MITDFKQLDLSKRYTYADYLTWQFAERVELLRGWVVKMSPAPNVRHQQILGVVFNQLYNYLVDHTCQVFSAPFDVRLPLPPDRVQGDKIDTVVQPDLVVVCDPTQLDEQGCIGPPTIVVEILSPGNTRREMKDKLELYQTSGVPEYWVVDPEHQFILVYTPNQQGQYVGSMPYTQGSALTSPALPGFSLDLEKVFV